MKKILVINGPNLNLLGLREPTLYGAKDFKALQECILTVAAELSLDVELFQSNHEGAIVDKIQAAYGVFDGILINPAAYTHTSVAILDALKAAALPTAAPQRKHIASICPPIGSAGTPPVIMMVTCWNWVRDFWTLRIILNCL